jgi:hypothetical protein
METCSKICAEYLAAHLSPQNCIGIRKAANKRNDVHLLSRVDEYMQVKTDCFI